MSGARILVHLERLEVGPFIKVLRSESFVLEHIRGSV